MQTYMQNFILIYLGIFAVGSGILWYVRNKAERETEVHLISFIRSVVFFFCCNYFLVSTIKWYLGSPENTLQESFWDISMQTYIHYSIPLVAAAILEPMLLQFIIREKAVRLMQTMDCFILSFSFLIALAVGAVSNAVYCIGFVICMVAALLSSFLCHKESQYIHKSEYCSSIIKAVPVLCAWMVTVGIFAPSELYFGNADEFLGSFPVLLGIMVIGSLLTAGIVLVLGFLFLPKKILHVGRLLLMGYICMGYVQGMFLNGKLSAMDGEEQAWSAATLIINSLVWLAVLGIVVLVGIRKKSVEQIMQWGCAYIALIQVVSLGYLAATANFKDKEQTQWALTTEGALEVAEENNILVFVLDCFESEWLEQIIAEDESFVEPLTDFTYYQNATSQFAHTATAIPYMLTGTTWSEEIEADYKKNAYQSSDALLSLKQQGFDLGIYTDIAYLAESAFNLTENYTDSMERHYDFRKTFATMVKTSMYKIAPFVLKPAYAYYSDDIKEMLKPDIVWSIDNDFPFYNSLRDNGLTVREGSKKAFRFYHMRGAHAPFYLSEDLKYDPTCREISLYSQGRGSMKIVYAYLEQLKSLGKYEDATIIITADHGQGNILDSEKTIGKPDRTSRPILIVKQPQEHNAVIKMNSAPVSQAELLPTILKAAGLDWQRYGRTFDAISPDEERKRKYIDIYKNYVIQYSVTGNAAVLENWEIEKAIYY